MTKKRPKVRLPNGLGMAQLGPSKWTKPERRVRMILVREGLRHECHWKIPGTSMSVDFKVGPVCILVDGRFWHDRRGRTSHMGQFWVDKVFQNERRDRRKRRILRSLGLRTFRVWDSDLAPKRYARAKSRLLSAVRRRYPSQGPLALGAGPSTDTNSRSI